MVYYLNHLVEEIVVEELTQLQIEYKFDSLIFCFMSECKPGISKTYQTIQKL